MIHGLSKHSGANNNSAKKAIDYFLSDDFYDTRVKKWKKREPAAELISGDREAIERLCAECEFKNRYTSGVLSFSEDESRTLKSEPEKLDQILEDWKNFAFAGIKDDCRPALIVKHEHKNRLEFHYLIPRTSIESGKYFNPFPPNYSGKRGKGANSEFINDNDTFTDFMCKKYGLQNPRAPEVKRSIKIDPRDNQKDIKQKLHNHLIKAVNAGAINNRADIITILKDSGFEITRAGADYISVKAPGSEKAMRLKGGIYEDRKSFEQFRTELELTADSRDFEKVARDYNSVLQKRTSEIKKRHRVKGAAALQTEKFEQQSANEIGRTEETLKDLRGNLPLFSAVYDSTIDFINNNPDILNGSTSGTRSVAAESIKKFTNAQQKAAFSGLLSDSEYEDGQDKIKELIENTAKLIELLIKTLMSLITGENYLDDYSFGGNQYSIAAKDLIRIQDTINAGITPKVSPADADYANRAFGFALKTKTNNEADNNGKNIANETKRIAEKTAFDGSSVLK